ncbi:hypothetical protein ADUPG1_008783 [Aduncisulcus paluster]|uniref:Uncharacterized protein n=1 Tax=Aduncisulcus paluster TaxID=2918883 RepID=A0ABQ5KT77_9EUKA|nr:hypothetical protein ADUPG1_008783 [Aduncisulcus paluster]
MALSDTQRIGVGLVGAGLLYQTLDQDYPKVGTTSTDIQDICSNHPLQVGLDGSSYFYRAEISLLPQLKSEIALCPHLDGSLSCCPEASQTKLMNSFEDMYADISFVMGMFTNSTVTDVLAPLYTEACAIVEDTVNCSDQVEAITDVIYEYLEDLEAAADTCTKSIETYVSGLLCLSCEYSYDDWIDQDDDALSITLELESSIISTISDDCKLYFQITRSMNIDIKDSVTVSIYNNPDELQFVEDGLNALITMNNAIVDDVEATIMDSIAGISIEGLLWTMINCLAAVNPYVVSDNIPEVSTTNAILADRESQASIFHKMKSKNEIETAQVSSMSLDGYSIVNSYVSDGYDVMEYANNSPLKDIIEEVETPRFKFWEIMVFIGCAFFCLVSIVLAIILCVFKHSSSVPKSKYSHPDPSRMTSSARKKRYIGSSLSPISNQMDETEPMGGGRGELMTTHRTSEIRSRLQQYNENSRSRLSERRLQPKGTRYQPPMSQTTPARGYSETTYSSAFSRPSPSRLKRRDTSIRSPIPRPIAFRDDFE